MCGRQAADGRAGRAGRSVVAGTLSTPSSAVALANERNNTSCGPVCVCELLRLKVPCIQPAVSDHGHQNNNINKHDCGSDVSGKLTLKRSHVYKYETEQTCQHAANITTDTTTSEVRKCLEKAVGRSSPSLRSVEFSFLEWSDRRQQDVGRVVSCLLFYLFFADI